MKEKWLRGTVVNVIVKKPDGAKRATTFVVARFTIGGRDYEPELSLQTLKAEDPTAAPTAPAVPPPVPPGEGNPLPMEPPLPVQNPPTEQAMATTTAPAASNSPADEEQEFDLSDEEESSGISSQGQQPVTSSHGRDWYIGATDVDVNGPTPPRVWKMICQYTGVAFGPGCDDTGDKYDEKLNAFTPYDFFMACFPRDQLRFMVDGTNIKL